MRLVKNEFLTGVPLKTKRWFVYKVTKWGLRLLFAMYDPGVASQLVNKIYLQAIAKEGSKLVYDIWVGVFQRKHFMTLTVGKMGGNTPKEIEYGIKVLKEAIKSLEGSLIRVKGVL